MTHPGDKGLHWERCNQQPRQAHKHAINDIQPIVLKKTDDRDVSANTKEKHACTKTNSNTAPAKSSFRHLQGLRVIAASGQVVKAHVERVREFGEVFKGEVGTAVKLVAHGLFGHAQHIGYVALLQVVSPH